MIGPFTHTTLPMRVVFGAGSLAGLPDEVDRLGLQRVLVLCSPEQQAPAGRSPPAWAERRWRT